ncbi:hypothetical protein [Clostridium thermarum]|uniref:hypothetical protein n=1 Tax=Clostridium thermarum TaxID=1716543 RepID=UPI00111D83E0|nr:hypothetical protein [Clostridium thermarum]
MANRFRAAIKGTSQEILSAGKVTVPQEEPVVVEPTMDIKEVDEQVKEKEIQPKEQISAVEEPAIEYPVYGDISFEKVSEFLKQKVNAKIFELRMSKVKDILNALVDYRNSHKPVMLCDVKDNIPYWIAAVKMSLPEKVGSTLVFRSYGNEKHPEITNCLIFIDEEEEKLNSKNYTDEDASVIVFNFAKGTSSRVTYNSKYSELAQVGYMLNDQSFYVFENFVDEFDYTKLGPDIDSCLELFYLINNGIEFMDYDSIENAMSFINKYAVKDTYKMLLQKMNVVVTRIGVDIDERTAFILTSTMVNMASKLGEEVFYHMVCKFLYSYTQSLLERTDESKIGIVYKFFNDIKELEGHDINQFAKYSLGEENVRKLSSYVSDYDSKYAKFYLSIVLDIIKDSNIGSVDNNLFEDFVSKCADRLIKSNVDLREIIGKFRGNLNYTASVLGLYYSKLQDNEIMRKDAVKFYMDKLEENNTKSIELRNLVFSTPKGKDLIFDEFIMKLEASDRKDEFFWIYSAQVFDSINGFKEKYFSEAIQCYLKLIKNELIYKDQCLKIINMASKNQVQLDDQMLAAIIEEYENQIPLAVQDKETKAIMMNLSNIKKSRKIVTTNNVAALTEFGMKLEGATNYRDLSDLLSTGIPDLTKVSDNKYHEFIEWTVNLLLNNSHSRIMDILTYYKKVTDMKEHGSERFVEHCLNIESIRQTTATVSKMNAKQVQFYMSIILEYLIKTGSHWNSKGAYEEFLNSCVDFLSNQSKELYAVLDGISDAREYFANILVRYYSNLNNNSSEAVKFLIERSKTNSEEWIEGVRQYISGSSKGLELLLNEFKMLFDAAEDKAEYFWYYNNNVFNKLLRYKKEYFSPAFEYYMTHIEGTERYTEECMNILEMVADEKVTLAPTVLAAIIKEYEATIPLLYPAEQTLSIIEEIENIKEKNNVTVTPNVGDILRLGIDVEAIQEPEMLIVMLRDTNVQIHGITDIRYSEYLNWCLPNVFNKISVLENAEIIRNVFYVEEHKEIFNNKYNELLMSQIRTGRLSASKSELLSLLKDMNLQVSELCNIIISYFSKQKELGEVKDSVGLFVDIIDSKSPEQATEMRRYISSLPHGNDILFEEYLSNLNVASNVQKFFWRYVKNVFNEIETYKSKYFVGAISKYLDSIEGTQDYSKACYELLNIIKEGKDELGNELEARILSGCEMMLSLSKSYESQEELIREIEDIKSTRNIKTSPDMVALVRFATEFEKIKDLDAMHKLLNNTNLQLQNMDIIKYEEFLDYFLPRAALSVNSWTLHAVIKKVFCVEKRKALFFTKYVAILADNIDLDKLLGAKIFAEFIIYFFNAREQHGEDLYVQVKTTLVNILYRLQGNTLKDINNSLKAEISGMRNKEMIIKDWDQMYSRVVPTIKSEQGFFGKLFDRR